MLLDEKINEHRTRTTKISQYRAPASWQPLLNHLGDVCVACRRIHHYLFIVRVLLLVIGADKFPWWIELLRVLGGEAYRRPWFPRSNWQLPFPGQLLALRGSCVVRWAPETSHVKAHFRIEQSYLCPARFQMQWQKVWTDGQIHLFHSPLMNRTSSFAHGMFVFHTLTFFFSQIENSIFESWFWQS